MMRRYGVEYKLGVPDPKLRRLGDAVGLQAAVGTGSQPAASDFDALRPWSGLRRCNLSDDGRVLAYAGQPAYRDDGTGGQVMVEIPRFYQLYEQRDGCARWWVSPDPVPGYRLSPAFVRPDGTQRSAVYVGAYLCCDDEKDGVATVSSRAGGYGRIRTDRPTWRALCRRRGSGWEMGDITYLCDLLQPLFVVEFATLNGQSVLRGICDMPYSDRWPIEQVADGGRQLWVDADYACQFVLGQGVAVGPQLGDNAAIPHATVTAIEQKPQGLCRVTLDCGGPAAPGMLLYTSVWKNGGADGVAASSGSLYGPSSGRSPIVYRGIENPYGNTWEWLDGVNIADRQAYVCTDPRHYDDITTTGPYQKVAYRNAAEDESYITAQGYDPALPSARFPTACTGGSASTYYSDCYWQRPGLRAVIFGGSWYNGSYAGPFCFSGWSASDMIHVNTSARLYYRG